MTDQHTPSFAKALEKPNEAIVSIARCFLEREEDGNAADFVSVGDLKEVCRFILKLDRALLAKVKP